MEGQQPRLIKQQMISSLMKLCIFDARTFAPIITHDELEPIMAKLGFVGLPPALQKIRPASCYNDEGELADVVAITFAWKEYVYSGVKKGRNDEVVQPKPKLPYPRIDGLHEYTYSEFLDAVNFYLGRSDISTLFHIRGVPLNSYDRTEKWRYRDKQDLVFIFRDGTLEESTFASYSYCNELKSVNPLTVHLRRKGTISTPVTSVVPIKDIIVNYETNETS